MPTILPDLTLAESLELTACTPWPGRCVEGDGLLRRPPFSAPHHDASKASIIGGGPVGSARERSVAPTAASCCLDEFPLLRTDVIDALRQPLESGE